MRPLYFLAACAVIMLVCISSFAGPAPTVVAQQSAAKQCAEGVRLYKEGNKDGARPLLGEH
jgi:hypothetical protein